MLAKTPPMGWNTWNSFGAAISEQLIMETADKFIEYGLDKVGYQYIVIDDCWPEMERDAQGRLVADKKKFPHGMKYLADYIHAKGLKFGIYSSASTRTCQGFPSSFDHEFQDAKLFAEWGVDYLKYDFCYKPISIDAKILYQRMGLALRECGRDIVYAACNSLPDVGDWIKATGAHLFRTTGDIMDNPASIRDIAFSQLKKLGTSGIDCFNDIDMLVVGMYNKGNAAVAFGGCTDEEYKMHFALWCMMSAPLMIGCDLRNTSQTAIELLKNKDLIRIDQDEEARPPIIVGGELSDKLILFKLLSNNEYALGVFNYTDGDERPIRVELFDLGISINSGCKLTLTDIFTGETFENVQETFRPHVPCHTCRIFKAKIVEDDR